MPPKSKSSEHKSPSVLGNVQLTQSSQSIADLIREARKAARRTSADVAEYLGVSEKSFLEYEMCLKSIPLHHICAISNYLSILPSALMAALARHTEFFS